MYQSEWLLITVFNVSRGPNGLPAVEGQWTMGAEPPCARAGLNGTRRRIYYSARKLV